MQNIGLQLRDETLETPLERSNDTHLPQDRKSGPPGVDSPRPVKNYAFSLLLERYRRVFRARDVKGLPTEAALLTHDRERAKGVATMERCRMVEHVKDTHPAPLISRRASTPWSRKRETLPRKDGKRPRTSEETISVR